MTSHAPIGAARAAYALTHVLSVARNPDAYRANAERLKSERTFVLLTPNCRPTSLIDNLLPTFPAASRGPRREDSADDHSEYFPRAQTDRSRLLPLVLITLLFRRRSLDAHGQSSQGNEPPRLPAVIRSRTFLRSRRIPGQPGMELPRSIRRDLGAQLARLYPTHRRRFVGSTFVPTLAEFSRHAISSIYKLRP
jgi:hypothetical protein